MDNLEQAHMLLPNEKRIREGAFYTPGWVAAKGIEYLDKNFPGWQDDPNTYIWDPCCGTGNLIKPLSKLDRVFMSTLDLAEIGQVKNLGIFPEATLFQFDFLNGDYMDLPETLKAVLEDETKRVIILMNPPYGEAGAGINSGSNKEGASFTKVKEKMSEEGIGKAANELFNQFLYRCAKWAPRSPVAVFATLKYTCAPGSASFRDTVWDYAAVDGFMVPAETFIGVKGKFPISFIIWIPDNLRINRKTPSFKLDIFDKNGGFLGTKEISDNRDYMNDWFKRPKCTEPSIPLKSALSIQDGKVTLERNAVDSFGYACVHNNDPQNSQKVNFVTGVYSDGHGTSITPSTFRQAMVQVAVRKLIAPTWLNDRDQFQVPFCDRATYKSNQEPGTTNLPHEFISDCVVWNLFAGHNQTSTLSGTYKEVPFILDNQFFPYSTNEVERWATKNLSITLHAKRSAETFVHNWLADQELSDEAKNLLEAGRAVYKLFYDNLPQLMLVKYSLQSWNPGWYQVRNSLADANLGKAELDAVKSAHAALKAKLEPRVYELGFLSK